MKKRLAWKEPNFAYACLIISCRQSGHHKGSAGAVLTTVSLSLCGKACETVVQQGGSDEGFIMQGEEMSALPHREPSRSHL